MEFLIPQALIALLLLPIGLGLYVLQQRRRAADAERFSRPTTRPSVSASPSRWRHTPPLLFLLSTALLILGAARPIQRVEIAQEAVRVVLTLDISGSMSQTDVSPTRLGAAIAVAGEFASDLQPDAELGLVTFNNVATLQVPPTRERERVLAVLPRLRAERGTAIGDAIQTSLAALTPQLPAARPDRPLSALEEANSAPSQQTPAPQGTIVLLTDGDSTDGSNPMEMAERAAAMGVRVYTVGLGNPEHGGLMGTLNEELLATIAARTGARYQRAGSLEDLQAIYQNLAHSVVLVEQKDEQAQVFALGGLALALAGSLLSLFRANRVC